LRKLDESRHRRELRVEERLPPVIPMAGHEHDVRTDTSSDRLERRRPFERVAVVKERDVPVLDEIAAEDDVGPGNVDDDVVVGVTAAQESEVHLAPADLDGGVGSEHAV